MSKTPVWRVAVPGPFAGPLDYLPLPHEAPPPGARLEVPLGGRRVVGVLLDTGALSELPASRLKPVRAVLDREPSLTPELLALARWAADYYHHPLGEVIAALLPVALRAVGDSAAGQRQRWRITDAGRGGAEALKRAPRQAHALRALRAADAAGLDADGFDAELGGDWPTPVRALVARGFATRELEDVVPLAPTSARTVAPPLNAAQQDAATRITQALGGYAAFLLDGVTGSGKTEVYLAAVEATLARGQQALVLVPEIGLTPQVVARFAARCAVPVVALHSGLADGERLAAWRAARAGHARVVLGTRSALWTPLPALGLIIVDEEHDASYKQQEGFRYSARDLALVRAQRAGLPVVLGSATPALESLVNVEAGRYTRLVLPERAGKARHPRLELVDLRGRKLQEGLSPHFIARLDAQLASGGQALIFLNRRGYAPTLTCHACGFIAGCLRCDARLVAHKRHGELRCHHCGSQQRLPERCPACQADELLLAGRGTERLEEWLLERYAAHGVARIDRDTTRRKGALDDLLADAHSGRARLLVGTQMLAKGHDFPEVGLVGIVEADHGLFGVDFRAAERMAQLIVQVAGRAGRAERPGEVLIQTRHPEHALLRRLLTEGYAGFVAEALAERRAAGFPPYGHLALLRAEAPTGAAAEALLVAARSVLGEVAEPALEVLGPAPAPMERRAGRHRWQLLLRSDARGPLHAALARLMPRLRSLPEARRARWNLDVDPQDLG
jgi:primosomal protein N' (replication factor Y)